MKRNLALLFVIVIAIVSAAQAQVPKVGEKETGLAAVYTSALNGHVTASGQVYDKSKLTAAHKTLPFGTKIRVTNAKNNKSVIVRVNDRGPMQASRILDLSPAAAGRLGISKRSMHVITFEVVELGNGKAISHRGR